MSTYRNRLLEPQIVSGVASVSELLLADSEEWIKDHTRGQVLLRMTKTVMQEKVSEQQQTIVEEPLYDSWKHHLVCSLPDGFRRRFLCYFWGIKPEAKRRKHEITMKRWVNYPDVITENGHAIMQQQLDMDSGWVS